MSDDDASKRVALEKRESGADARLYSPSAARNRGPILEVLRHTLPKSGDVLEIGSGTGEHAVFFAKAMPAIMWQPSDPDSASRSSIEAWTRAEALLNVREPLDIDVCADVWGIESAGGYQALVSINMIHIAPWEATLGLFAGAARILRPSDILFLYGPFMRAGRHTAQSNAEFDASLKARNPKWGLRDIADLARVGEMHRLSLRETVAMPANNFCLVFGRQSPPKRRKPVVKVDAHIPPQPHSTGTPMRLKPSR
jgi:SAM-dependent methyltransferase